MTLLTDYGPGSEHVGALHAVLASACPGVARIDLAHDIPPGDVAFGAVVLARLVSLAPVGVHLAVVDPGVGTARRAVAVRCVGDRTFVGPDNGLLAVAFDACGIVEAVALESPEHRREPVAPTFHGRDVFAPAAAHLATGGALGDLGPALDRSSLVRPALTAPVVQPGLLRAVVLGVDRFGNVELNAGPADLDVAFGSTSRLDVAAAGGVLPVTRAAVFADVATSDGLIFVDAAGHVAIAIRDGDLAGRLALAPGHTVTVTAG